jgi:hypothetical protein
MAKKSRPVFALGDCRQLLELLSTALMPPIPGERLRENPPYSPSDDDGQRPFK